ncbi:3-oxoacyl-[acyl-carrier protein] reductase [Mycolicibacterium iranicum]|uniref:3-oxoacyl-[acyl-carrier protein] reductase n=1 Tax=Mycolicibacterium iranicum TaxID=912594 RepID=A0A839QD37_MYCIR|nr:SDR family oxidoreductase [Mycolicibacterium iranicum]MBB2991182.1 3-oxoacyl-[acyl-carrier protein] reductase [Mycolicibacterium iranicum]
MSTTPLSERRALVTGGSRGIGAEIVRRLAADGAAVAFTYAAASADAEALVADIESRGGTASAIRADAADPAQIAAAVDEAADRLGGLDVLVNNAGIGHFSAFEDTTAEQYDRLIAVNVNGVYWASRYALAHLGDGSRIINIGSINADRVPGPGITAYAMTKGAVSSLTRGLARELGPRGITVNNVQPGPINTDLNPEDSEFAEGLKAQVVALGRYGHPRDVAAVVSFLAGSESGFVTGANWNVDGGFTA